VALSFKVLGQTGDASSEVTLYTAPPGVETKVYVIACNRGSAATYRVALVPGGGATGNENYIEYDEALPANKSYSSRTFTLEATDVIRVQSSTANVSFTALGAEQT
jgi:hypothetical protein